MSKEGWMFGMRWFPGGMGLWRVGDLGAHWWRPAWTHGVPVETQDTEEAPDA